ncbi:hypothetical protein [Pseudozobellia sp. WGM2]|uniref:hypothetical protein n=1 Tax=Pseudozobellia sp. WGM2 TaxID=2787625 RepID=UPI001ADFD526|nr:hypothetical protein [Pseudozobellia sp. WGM2]
MKSYALIFIHVLVIGVILILISGAPEVDEYSVLDANVQQTETEEAFDKMMDVLTHQRCMNCHPNDNVPKQGEDRHPHYFDMARGKADKGFQATKCATCHQEENNDYSGAPGAPHWSLAPKSMGWQGLSRTEIARIVLDPETNGGKSNEELVKHMTEDELVLWAWEPGIGVDGNLRELPPVSEEEFKKAVEIWFENGAVIPSK